MRGKNKIYQILTAYIPEAYQIYHKAKQCLYQLKWIAELENKSSWFLGKTPKQVAKEFKKYNVISFDVFDTLIFRPYSGPTKLFEYIAEQIKIPEFRKIRCEMEQKARWEQNRREGNTEVTLDEIYAVINRETKIEEKVKEIELFEEYRVCYANPYMKQVVEELRKDGKRIIVISDMYLNQIQIGQILEGSGYSTFDAYYISCEYRKSKSSGELYQVVLEQEGKNCLFAHIGDNKVSDVKQAKRYGIDAFYYRKE